MRRIGGSVLVRDSTATEKKDRARDSFAGVFGQQERAVTARDHRVRQQAEVAPGAAPAHPAVVLS